MFKETPQPKDDFRAILAGIAIIAIRMTVDYNITTGIVVIDGKPTLTIGEKPIQ